MMTIHPNISADDLKGVTALFALLADKEACAKRLAELQAAGQEADAKAKAAQDAATKATADAATIVAAKQAHQKAVTLHTANVTALDKETNSFRDSAARKEAALAARATALDAKAQDIQAREDAAAKREAKIAADAAATTTALNDAAAKQADLAARIALIKKAQA